MGSKIRTERKCEELNAPTASNQKAEQGLLDKPRVTSSKKTRHEKS